MKVSAEPKQKVKTANYAQCEQLHAPNEVRLDVSDKPQKAVAESVCIEEEKCTL